MLTLGIEPDSYFEETAMPVRIHEVVVALTMVLILLACKYVPALDHLPLSQWTGLVCFTFAIHLCLGIRRDLIAEHG